MGDRDGAEREWRSVEGRPWLLRGMAPRSISGVNAPRIQTPHVLLVGGEASLATYLVYVEPGSHEARATLDGHVDGVGRFEGEIAIHNNASEGAPVPCRQGKTL